MTAPRRVLRHGVLADGTPSDVVIDAQSGMIAAVGTTTIEAADEVIDCTGLVIVPSAVDPHAHLDKALSSREVAAMPPTLAAAVDQWIALWPQISKADFIDRATEAVEAMVARGTTAIRTHVDIGVGVGLLAVDALVEVRDRMQARGLADIQVVGLAAPPLGGDAGKPHRYLLEAAVGAGVDVIGGSPDLDDDPRGATRAAVEVAACSGLPIDLHTDQSVDSSMFYLPDFVQMISEYGVTNAVASHCISLMMQPLHVQHETAAAMASAGVAVTTMPLTSLFYFGWDTPVAPPRGLTAITVLREAGVTVAAGADNVQDIFFALGRFDPFETAAVLAMAAHVTPADAWEMCTTEARSALRLPPVKVAPGFPADLVAIAGRNLNEAVALASEHRIVFRGGRVVARTSVTRELR